MSRQNRSQVAGWTIAALLTLSATVVACVDEKIVYRDAPRFQNPPAGAVNYLGYNDTTLKATACGGCHVEIQSQWKGTGHAGAWKTLGTSTTNAVCQGCHSVGHLGNADTTKNAGYVATKDARYADVQCENCHGPGLAHATNPLPTNVLLPSMKVDTSSAARAGTCGECHAGAHHPYLSEWRASAHGTMPNASPRSRVECQACHTGQGALKAWGVDQVSNYKEKNFAGADTLRITCAVCHDPHQRAYDGQLRVAVTDPEPSRNLCMQCHNRRAIPEISSQTRGPHSAEGPLVIGQGGWEPAGFAIPSAPISHGSATANPRLCATCHVTKFTVNDSAGKFLYTASGHLFSGAPCVDGTGKPTLNQECGWTTTARNFNSCATSGCHSSTTAALNLVLSDTAAIRALGTTLRQKLNLVPAGQIKQDSVYSVAEGARFNWLMAFDSLTGVGVRIKMGQVIHNAPRLQTLLAASILALNAQYGLPAVRDDEAQLLRDAQAKTGLRLAEPGRYAHGAQVQATLGALPAAPAAPAARGGMRR